MVERLHFIRMLLKASGRVRIGSSKLLLPLIPERSRNPADPSCYRMRLKIWKEVSFQTRNICLSINRQGEFNLRDDSDDDDNEGEVFESFVYLAACPHPPILHIYHESRVGGLNHYTLDFGFEQKRSWPLFTFSSPARVSINWKADRICISEDE